MSMLLVDMIDEYSPFTSVIRRVVTTHEEDANLTKMELRKSRLGSGHQLERSRHAGYTVGRAIEELYRTEVCFALKSLRKCIR